MMSQAPTAQVRDRRRRVASLAGLALLLSTATAFAGEHQITPDIVYGHKLGMALTLDEVQPAQPNGAGVLFMVSGGWVSRWADPAAMDSSGQITQRFGTLLDHGYTVFLVRHGSSPTFKVPDAVDDVRRAVRYVRHNAATLGVDPNRLGVFGGSAGGHLSLMLGLASDQGDASSTDPVEREPLKIAAVAAYFPPVDLRTIVGPSDRFPALDFDKEKAAGVSPILFATADDPPVLLVHGDKDTLVPIANSESMYQTLQGLHVATKMIVMPGAGHGFQGEDAAKALVAVADWFDQYLSPSAAVATSQQ